MRAKMILGILALMVLSLVILADAVEDEPVALEAEAAVPARALSLLDDTRFERGFTVWDPAPGKHVARGMLQPNQAKDEPVWGLAQWHSRFSLAGAKAELLPSGAERFFDGAKAVTLGPPGSPEADLILAIDARTEYQNRMREPGDPWPHLLADRELLHHPFVAELQAVRFRLNYRLLKSEAAEVPGFDSRLHAAQFNFYITVQNLNRQSAGFGDFFWVGVQLYDSRYRLSPAYAAPDFVPGGEGKFIFNPDMSRLTRESAHDGEWVSIDADLLPFILEGIETAWQRGYMKDSRDLSDYRLGEMNIGWEVTGPFDVAMQVKVLKLEAMVTGPSPIVAEFDPEHPEWLFNDEGNTEGWGGQNSINIIGVTEGTLKMGITGNDPSIFCGIGYTPIGWDNQRAYLNVDAKEHPKLYAKMALNPNNNKIEFYYVTKKDTQWSERQVKRWTNLAPSGEMQKYEFEMDWQGVITGLRVDFSDGVGIEVEIDYLSFVGHVEIPEAIDNMVADEVTGGVESSPPEHRIEGAGLSVGEGGILYKDGKPFRAIGVNYSDAFERVLLDPSDTSYKQGVAELAAQGIPFARFMATGFWPIHLEMYQNDRETYLKRLDGVIQAAEDSGVGLIPSLFWADFTVPDLVGEPRNQWGNPNSKTIAFMRRYTRDIVSRYKDSPAIWAWEFGNEYSLQANLPNAADWRPPIVPELGTPLTRGPEDDLTTDMIVTAFKEFATVVRSIDPTRPITTGNSIPRNFAEDIRSGNSWSELDTRADFKANISLVTPFPHDMVSIHLYPGEVLAERFEPGYHASYSELIFLAMEASVQEGKALFVGEFGANDITHGGAEEAARIIQEILDALVENGVPLAAIWVYDRVVTDDESTRGWNITASNSRSYILKAIREANEAISVDSDRDGLPDPQNSRTIWFAPLPPLPQHEGRPFIGSLDFIDLFNEDAPWGQAADKIEVFKLYGEWVAYNATDEELERVVADLNQRNIAIAFEAGPLTPTDTCGDGIEGFAGPEEGLLIANRINTAGGTVSFIALDEPFFYGSLYSGPNACNWSAETIAQEVASYINAIKSVFPDVVVGDIEPLPRGVNVAEYMNWLDTYRAVTGSDLAFIHLDLDFTRPDWLEATKALENFAHERGINFGIIYTGDYHDTSDAEWLAHAEERMVRYETQVTGQPDHVIFQSWVDHPDYTLPETDSTTFTHLINLYFRTRTVLNISPSSFTPDGFLEVTGMLADLQGMPLAESSVKLCVKAHYEPSTLESSVVLVNSTITDMDGMFQFTFDEPLPLNLLLEARYDGVKTPQSAGDEGYWPAYAQTRIGDAAENLARNKPVSTSSSLPTSSPSMAVDGNFETWWNSRDFPPQWIEVDLQAPFSIWQIRMAVSQFPEGKTVHRVWVKGPDLGDDYSLLHELSDFTIDPQVLEYTAPAPIENIQYIKIETVVSPSWVSWREIDIIPWVSSSSTTVAVEKDTEPPAMPKGLTATAKGTTVTLTWTANSEMDLSHYIIFRSVASGFEPGVGNLIAKVDKPNVTYTDTALTGNITYYYKVIAVDNVGNRSKPSAEARATPIGGYSLSLAKGINLICVPLQPQKQWKLSDLAGHIGLPYVSMFIYYDTEADKFTTWMPKFPEESPVNAVVEGGKGYIVMMKSAREVTFTGEAWDGKVRLEAGINCISVPLEPDEEWRLSDLAEYVGPEVNMIIRYDVGSRKFVAWMPAFPETSPVNAVVKGGEGYIVVMNAAKSVTFTGKAWQNAPSAVPSATPTLALRDITNTPVLAIEGSVVQADSSTMLNSIQVQVSNANARVSDLDVTGKIAGSGRYVVTLVDLSANRAAKVGDVLQIEVVAPTDTFAAEVISYTVTAKDVQLSKVSIGNLRLSPIPSKSALLANYPNPFNPETWIPYALEKEADIIITIYDVAGRVVRVLNLGRKSAGFYISRDKAAYWDGRNEHSEKVASSVYFYTIQAGDFTATRKMLMIK